MCGIDIIESSGIRKSPTSIKLDDKMLLVDSIALYHVILKCKPELNQFMLGLRTLGTLDEIQNHPDLFEILFVAGVNFWYIYMYKY